MNRWRIYVLLPFWLLFSFTGCENKAHSGDERDASVSQAAPVKEAVRNKGKKQANPGAQVARIVFVGQKDACHCTHDRIDTSWEALQAVLAKVEIPVERIQQDVDKAAAERYAKLRSPMVLPAIYFLDDNDKLVELLQGEVTEKQITKIIR